MEVIVLYPENVLKGDEYVVCEIKKGKSVIRTVRPASGDDVQKYMKEWKGKNGVNNILQKMEVKTTPNLSVKVETIIDIKPTKNETKPKAKLSDEKIRELMERGVIGQPVDKYTLKPISNKVITKHDPPITAKILSNHQIMDELLKEFPNATTIAFVCMAYHVTQDTQYTNKMVGMLLAIRLYEKDELITELDMYGILRYIDDVGYVRLPKLKINIPEGGLTEWHHYVATFSTKQHMTQFKKRFYKRCDEKYEEVRDVDYRDELEVNRWKALEKYGLVSDKRI